MAYDERLAERVRELLAGRRGFSDRKMFGGIGFLLDGKFAAGVHGPDLMVRVPPEQHARYVKEAAARTFDMTGRPMEGWLFVGPAGTKTAASLKKWVTRSADYAATLPATKKKKVKR